MDSPAEIVVTDAAGLEGCCAAVARCAQVGLDTEFVGEDSYHPRLCLIQLATPEALYLIDPFAFAVEEMRPLWELLADPARVVVLHAGREEVRLCHRAVGRAPGNLFDLQIAAGLVGMVFPVGYGMLVGEVLGQRLAKNETLTEWRTRPLTRAQVRYAFDDVRYLLPLWRELNGRLEKLGRLDWAQEDFARMCTASTPEEPGAASPAEGKWRKLRGAGSLDRRRLAILREAFRWREDEAERVNRPARTVLRDDLLVEIARRSPKSDRDLHVVRGLARRYAGPLWEAIERARALPAEELPLPAEREQDPVQVGMVANVLGAALADFCNRERLAPNLVATGQDVKLLVRARLLGLPAPAESLLSHGWRGRHVLPHLEALLDGRRSLTIADVRSETPFAYHDRGPRERTEDRATEDRGQRTENRGPSDE
jgi:ribonuclease D